MFIHGDTYSFNQKIITFLSKGDQDSYKFRDADNVAILLLRQNVVACLEKIRLENFFYEDDKVIIKLKSKRTVISDKNIEINLEEGFTMKNQILNVYFGNSGKRVYSFDISKDGNDFAELICEAEELSLDNS